MPKLPVVSGNETIRAFSKAGFIRIRQRGSHVVLQRAIADSTITLVVPIHSELAKGTLRGLLRKAGLSVEQFAGLLRQ